MSTALSTHHHISNPIAAGVAVLAVIAGATVLGVTMAQDDAAPSNPPAPTQVIPNPPSRVGQGDFSRDDTTQTQKAPDQRDTSRGGRLLPGMP
jgi:hypothetical protein